MKNIITDQLNVRIYELFMLPCFVCNRRYRLSTTEWHLEREIQGAEWYLHE